MEALPHSVVLEKSLTACQSHMMGMSPKEGNPKTEENPHSRPKDIHQHQMAMDKIPQLKALKGYKVRQ
jgi:hypothetical protein